MWIPASLNLWYLCNANTTSLLKLTLILFWKHFRHEIQMNVISMLYLRREMQFRLSNIWKLRAPTRPHIGEIHI